MDEQGQQIGPYRLDERLGEGGQSVVWKATDLRSGATVALKKMRPLTGQLQHPGRFRREALLLLSFSDPGLPRGIELLEGPGGPEAIVMEFIDGRPLHKLLGEGPRSLTLLWPLFLELARLVALLHERGIAHRDIKQPNILVRPGWEQGAPGSVVLVDLGIARGSAHTAYTSTGATVGTCAFMAPELLVGMQEPSVRDFLVGDVYALGVVFWSLLTGRLPSGLPVQAPLAQLLSFYTRGITFAPEPAQIEAFEREIPGFVRVIERCVAPRPSLRFQDAGELQSALRDLARGVSPGPLPLGLSPQASTCAPDLSTSALLSRQPLGVEASRFSPLVADTTPDPGGQLLPTPVLAPFPTPAPAAVQPPAPRTPPKRSWSVPWFGLGLGGGVILVFFATLALLAPRFQEPSRTPSVPSLAPAIPWSSSTPVATAAPVRVATVVLPASNQNGILRSGPGPQFSEVEQIPRGGQVRLITPDPGTGWVFVQSPRSGMRGFMHRDILRFLTG